LIVEFNTGSLTAGDRSLTAVVVLQEEQTDKAEDEADCRY